jgi:4-hydroxybenzoate polyprenyltransferase
MNLKPFTTAIATFTAALLLLSAVHAQPTPSDAPGVVRWTCNAFYLPARSIWQRTVDVELDANGVRSVQIDGVAVYAFSIQGSALLTAVDGERIQFDPVAQTWSSDLRGIVSSQGRCGS